jgi:hypothetical protein
MDKKDLNALKDKAIAEYKRIKVSVQEYNDRAIPRRYFLNNTDLSKSNIDKCFGNYSSFVDIAEDKYRRSLTEMQRALLSERTKKIDLSATKEDCIEDLRKLQQDNFGKFITRVFYRQYGKYSDSTWDRYFGSFAEFRKQAGLELTRHQQRLERDIAKHAAHDFLREFNRVEVEPYANAYNLDLSTGQYKTILVGSDFHDIDMDEFFINVFIDTARRMQPNVIVLNGDVFDCYDSGKYDKDIRQLKIVERFNYVKERLFRPLREACPNSQIDLILGNHEWRICILLAAKTPNLRVILSDVMGLSLADVFGVKEFKINLISKVDLAAFSRSDMKNEMRKNYKVYYDCFYVGHFKDLSCGMSGTSGHCHRPSTETFTNLTRGKCFWVETGCMCITDAEYVAHRDKWGNSFLVAHVDTVNKTVNPEHFILSGDSIVVHGIRYSRK